MASFTDRQQRTTELLQRMGLSLNEEEDAAAAAAASASYPSPPSLPPSNLTTPQPSTIEEPYYARLYNDHARKQQKFKERAAELSEEENTTTTPTPTATTFSSRMSTDNDVERILPGEGDLSQRLETWRKRRNERRQEAKNLIIQEQEALMRETPEINAYSHELADELIADGKRHPDVSEHLYSLAPEFDRKVEWMKAQQMAAEVPATPAITRMAMSLEREGKVGDRLYEAALETRAKLSKARQKAAASDEFKASRGGVTPETKARQKNKVIGHSLYERAVNTRNKKDAMRKKQQSDIEKKQNKKHIRPTVRCCWFVVSFFFFF